MGQSVGGQTEFVEDGWGVIVGERAGFEEVGEDAQGAAIAVGGAGLVVVGEKQQLGVAEVFEQFIESGIVEGVDAIDK